MFAGHTTRSLLYFFRIDYENKPHKRFEIFIYYYFFFYELFYFIYELFTPKKYQTLTSNAIVYMILWFSRHIANYFSAISIQTDQNKISYKKNRNKIFVFRKKIISFSATFVQRYDRTTTRANPTTARWPLPTATALTAHLLNAVAII